MEKPNGTKKKKAGWIACLWDVLLTFLLLVAGELIALPIYMSPLPEEGVRGRVAETAVLYLLFAGIWVAFLLFMLIVRKDRETLRHLGTRSPGNTLKAAALGLAFGAGLNGLCALLAWLNGDIALYFDRFDPLPFLILLVAVFIQSGAEELVYREFLYRRFLRRFRASLPAVILTAALFAAMHLANPGVNALSVFNIFAFGVLMSLIVYYWDSFWAVAWLHAGWNFTQNILLGLPNSGNVVPYSVFRLEASNARNSIFYNVGFGIEGALSAALVLLPAIYLIFIVGRNATGKKIELPEPETAPGGPAETGPAPAEEAGS